MKKIRQSKSLKFVSEKGISVDSSGLFNYKFMAPEKTGACPSLRSFTLWFSMHWILDELGLRKFKLTSIRDGNR